MADANASTGDSVPYTVGDNEDYQKVAEKNGVWSWWDLVAYNRGLEPDKDYNKNPDLLKKGDVVRVPKKSLIEAARKLLTDANPEARKLLTGKGYIGVWGKLSFSLLDEFDKPRFPSGSKFQLRDADGDAITFLDFQAKPPKYANEGTINELGGFEVDAPRTDYNLYVQLPGKTQWKKMASIDASQFEARRARIKGPDGWLPEQQELLKKGGIEACFPDFGGGFDLFSLGGFGGGA